MERQIQTQTRQELFCCSDGVKRRGMVRHRTVALRSQVARSPGDNVEHGSGGIDEARLQYGFKHLPSCAILFLAFFETPVFSL